MDESITFPNWLHLRGYKDNTIRRYLAALDRAVGQFNLDISDEIINSRSSDDFNLIYSHILSHPLFPEINNACHRDLQAGLNSFKKYISYIENGRTAQANHLQFTPSWFEEMAQSPEMIEYKERSDYARVQFCKDFGINELRSLSGRELLTRLFYNDTDNKDNLCYTLEFNPEIRELFGSIAGGSSYKYGLFFHKKSNCWMSGSPNKPNILSENEAIHTAERIRDMLVAGAEILDAHDFVNCETDYDYLYNELEHIPIIDNIWVLKYYQMLFPEMLPVFYGRSIQFDVLSLLGIDPSPIPFVRMGQISLFIKECKITSPVFAQIFYRHCQQYLQQNAPKHVNALSDSGSDSTRFWLYTPGEAASMWDEFYHKGIMAIGWGELGDLHLFASKKEIQCRMKDIYNPTLSYINSAFATWQFANEMKPGDIVFVKKGRTQIIGRGIVQSEYKYIGETEYPNIRAVEWTHRGEWVHPDGQAVLKTLTEITPYSDYIEKLSALFFDENDDEVEEQAIEYDIYSESEFLSDVFMLPKEYESLVHLLRVKKNIILQGAPGVGKTYAAKRLAYSIMGQKDSERVMMVQFHQSYSYEDFIMGFRPSETGFELRKGVFYNFCKKAEIDSDNDYFFIIDEINRGNLSRIFGELFMLIERDKRGIPLQLLYSDEKFSVPENVYIIGMMNTADRSLAMLDYALRRRFAFFDLHPGFSSDGFKEYRLSLNNPVFNKVIQCVEQMNSFITADSSLGDGFCIGHSYFCGLKSSDNLEESLSSIVEYEIIPLLKEYWFDDSDKVSTWTERLRSALL